MNALSVLKSRAVLLVAALAVGLSSTAAHAQYQTERVQFDAPFAFDFGSQHLAAGRYVVSRENLHILRISGGSKNVMAMTQTTDDRERTEKGKIVFHKYGERYFLTQVWIPGKSSHITFDQKKAEKRAEVATSGAAPATVELALLEPAR